MIYNRLIEIKKELDLMATNKNAIKEGVQLKLDRIEENYDRVVELNCDYILSRSNYKVLRALEAFQRKKEKEDEEEAN